MWIETIRQLATNPLFAGLIGATLTGGVLYWLRAAPKALLKLLRSQFTSQILLHNDEQMYTYLDIWLSRERKADNARRLTMVEAYSYEKEEWDHEFTLGYGWHLIRDEGSWYLFARNVQEKGDLAQALGGGRQKSIEIISLGRNPATLRRLLDKAKRVYEEDGMVKVFYWADGSYKMLDRKRKRSIDTVFIPDEQKQRILSDMQRFVHDDTRALYNMRGTPYRRGYAFEGPPGTGKTTMILVMAGVLNRDLYIIAPPNIKSDAGLHAALNDVPRNGLAVIEDIDTAKVTQDRKEVAAKSGLDKIADQASEGGITLSGLLNAIDGVGSRDGRVLCITSNHIQHLDPALMRPGRVDMIEHIGLILEPDARRMHRLFYPEDSSPWFDEVILPQLPMIPSDLQNQLIKRGDSHAPSN